MEEQIAPQPNPKRGPKRRVYVPPAPAENDDERMVVKEYKTKSSRVLKGGVVKDYESIAHRIIPYIETREYKKECREIYSECLALVGACIKDKKKLIELREAIKQTLAPPEPRRAELDEAN